MPAHCRRQGVGGASASSLRRCGKAAAARQIDRFASRPPGRDSERDGRARGARRFAAPTLAALVTAVSFYFLLPSLAAVFSSWRSLSQLRWYWAGLALLAEAAGFVSLWELGIALKTRAWFTVACAQLSGNAVGRVLPGGGATAAAFTVSMLRKTGLEAGEAAAALGASTALQIATTLALPLFALPAMVGGAPVPRSLAASAYLGGAVLLVLVAGGAVAFATDRPLRLVGRALQWLLNATVRRRRTIDGLADELIAQRDFIRSTIGERALSPALSVNAAGFPAGSTRRRRCPRSEWDP
jgi:hypothetical protein